MKDRMSWPLGALLAILLAAAPGLAPQLAAQQAEPASLLASLQSLTPSDQTPSPSQQTRTPEPQTPAAPSPSPAKPSDEPGQKPPAKPKSTQENDRIFFALPNYLTVEKSSSLPPLTTKEKFKAVAEGCFDPVEAVFIAVQAGIDQADNVEPSYHQGFVGYSKRFGTAYADAAIGNFGTGAIFPTLLRQDPRYYQMGKGNFFRRFSHAAFRVVITRGEKSQKPQFNFSEFLGNGMAAGLSNTYHPGPHTIASTADVEGTQIVLDAAGYELKEFWPDLRRLLVRARRKT